ncbi:MAG TPA: hypothetical protein VG894_05135 [Bauldia sp.]|nr:hypothetical protein [Bauldia sp.]
MAATPVCYPLVELFVRRLGNARTILEIEAIVGRPEPGVERLRWQIQDVACTISKHRYAGEDYSLAIDVLAVRHQRPGRPWQLILTSEHWRAGNADLRATKWLKLQSGRPADVMAWIAARRDQAPSRPHNISLPRSTG